MGAHGWQHPAKNSQETGAFASGPTCPQNHIILRTAWETIVL